MEALMNNVFVVDESVPMVQSVKAVLDSDGYLVQILTPGFLQDRLNEVPASVVDALGSIRTVRDSFPRMSQIVLVPISHS